MVYAKEDDGAFKSNSSPKADVTPVVLTPTTIPTTSKEEGNTTVDPKINQDHNKQTKGETDKAQTVSEDAVIEKDEKNAGELIKGGNLVMISKEKRRKPTKRTKKKKVVKRHMRYSKTKANCFQYKILGLPAGKKDEVAKIYKGMRLFLFDVDLRLMYGIFKVVGNGGYNIEPTAFKYAFPYQVRFIVMEDCLPLAEEKFRKLATRWIQREALPSPTRHVARHLPHDVVLVTSYGYEMSYAYARDSVVEHRPYHGPDTDNYDLLYCREAPPIYCDNIYPDQMMEYPHQPPRAAMLPPRYHLPQPEEYHHISGGLQVRGYDDVGDTADYFSFVARTHYGY
ncbi:hypothetical protein L1887_12455 [Cichorium endivia]|nr:hypothetical protein L1887_12455 [Cichorium endivia]